MILLLCPLESDITSNQVLDDQGTLPRHLQPHHGLSSLRFEPLTLLIRLCHPMTAIHKARLRTLGRLTLGLNLFWSVLFFGGRMIGLALAEILLLWVFILGTTVVFWKVDRTAGVLMVPYLGWVAFAAYLNAGFYLLN